jgi:hypothetical protein
MFTTTSWRPANEDHQCNVAGPEMALRRTVEKRVGQAPGGRPVRAEPIPAHSIRPAQAHIIILTRKLGLARTDLPAEMLVIERQGKWFKPAGREITGRAALLECSHQAGAQPEPRYGKIAGHTCPPKPLTTNWPKPYRANGGKCQRPPAKPEA